MTTSETDEFRSSLVAAVQAELERHASAVVAEVDRLRDESRRDRDEMRSEFTSQMAQLAQALERVQARAEEQAAGTRTQLEQRVAEAEQRQVRRLDDVTGGLESMVAQAARPIVTDLREEIEVTNRRVESLDANLRRFDEQAARMVTYFNDMTTRMEGRQEELAEAMRADVTAQVDELKRLVDENDSAVRKFQTDVGQQVTSRLNDAEDRLNNRLLQAENRIKDESGQKIAEVDLQVSRVSSSLDELKRLVDENDMAVRKFQTDVGQQVTSRLNDAEDRFNNRLLETENRIKEESGQKIAEIDLHVSRVSSSLDESLAVMNDRISAIDDRFTELNRQLNELADSVEGINQDALDEVKERMSTVAGEAMLVRIEMERLEKGVNERTDSLAVRMTEVETAVQDATMDVSTAVQLDRLEEIERALLEIDPTQFVRKDGADPTVAAPSDPNAPLPGARDQWGGSGNESVENSPAPADATSGPDIAAIIAAAERSGRNASDHHEED